MYDPARGKTEIRKFLKLSAQFPVIDVRSPAEFERGHIPGAVNIPLFTDKEREEVGITFRKTGRLKAVLKGMELIGPQAASKLVNALTLAEGRKLLVYCWRGGMRSEAMDWLFSTGGIATEVLHGGYKAYRNHILQSLSERRKMVVLGGFTGSGKTDILKYLGKAGETVIDLERLANHRGSAFGSLGQESQHTSEHFANLLYVEWQKAEGREPVWLEDESRNIGSVFMPDNFYSSIQLNPVIVILMPPEARIPNLVKEYATFPAESLKASVMKIHRRLGGERTKETLKAIDEGNFSRAAGLVLEYYDRAYLFGLRNKPEELIYYVQTDTSDVRTNAYKVLEVKDKIKSI